MSLNLMMRRRMNKSARSLLTLVELVAVGAIIGEIVFSIIYSPAEDYWQHYQAASALLTQRPIQAYNYPAATAILFVPFALLPSRVSFVAWLLTTYVTFAIALSLMGLTRRDVLIWLAWPHIFASGFVGQLDCLVFLALALSLSLRNKMPLCAGLVAGLGLVKFHLLLPLIAIVWQRHQWRWLGGFGIAIVIFGTLSILLPQSYPGRLTYVLDYYVRHPGSVGIPSRLSGLPVEAWLGLVVLLGLAWLWILAADRDAAWILLPAVYPYFPGFDLSVIIPVLARNRFAPLLYIIVGFPFLLNQILPFWLVSWTIIGGLLIGGSSILTARLRHPLHQPDVEAVVVFPRSEE